VLVDPHRLGAALPGYEIGPLLGQGTWSAVYAARHRHMRRDVAVKVLSSGVDRDAVARRRFDDEARLLASLDHPHIVPVHDSGDHDGMCLIVMERLPHGTLGERLRPRSRSRSQS
jgi:serine/threonine protein kinase